MVDIDMPSKRPLESLWETGVAPLFVGSSFFMLGTSDLLKRFLPQAPLAQQGLSWVAVCFTFVALAAVALWGKRSVSRTGAITPSSGSLEPKSRKWLLVPVFLVPLVLLPLVIVYALTTFGRQPDPVFLNDTRLIAPGFAILLGVISLHHGRTRKVPLLPTYGIYLLCLALLIWWLPLSPTERFGLLESGAGGPLSVYGAMRLRAVLNADPKPSLH